MAQGTSASLGQWGSHSVEMVMQSLLPDRGWDAAFAAAGNEPLECAGLWSTMLLPTLSFLWGAHRQRTYLPGIYRGQGRLWMYFALLSFSFLFIYKVLFWFTILFSDLSPGFLICNMDVKTHLPRWFCGLSEMRTENHLAHRPHSTADYWQSP